MKKQMIALAVAGAFAGSAFAANVDVYGVVDTGLVYTQTEVGGVLSSAKAEGHKFSMDSGVNSGNRLGLRGTEDLGDGYSVSFRLENGWGGARNLDLKVQAL